MLIHIILASIYLNVKPDQNLIIQFFGLILVCQLFNFDYLGQYGCGTFAIGFGFLQSIVPLSIVVSIYIFHRISLLILIQPNLIETRNTKELSILKLCLSALNSVTWIMWSYESSHFLYMAYFIMNLTTQVTLIQFYQWANDQKFSSRSYNGETLYLNSSSSHQSDSESSYVLVNLLIPFFK